MLRVAAKISATTRRGATWVSVFTGKSRARRVIANSRVSQTRDRRLYSLLRVLLADSSERCAELRNVRLRVVIERPDDSIRTGLSARLDARSDLCGRILAENRSSRDVVTWMEKCLEKCLA